MESEVAVERSAEPSRPTRMALSNHLGARLAAAVVLASLLAGCGEADGSSPSSSVGTTTTASGTTPGPGSTTTAPDDLMPTGRPDRSPRITATGTVTAGVENGCLGMTIRGQSYTLIGEVAGLRAGASVTVTGYADPTVMTTCQSGIPFVVLTSTGG